MIAKVYTSKEIHNIIEKHNKELGTSYIMCRKQHEPTFFLQEFKGNKYLNNKLTPEESKELLQYDFFYQNVPNYWHLYYDLACDCYILVWEHRNAS
jgi:hypothetical protein